MLECSVGKEPPFKEDLNPEADIVGAVTRQLLVKTMQAEKTLRV
jgi:hypothetical protein